MTSKEAKNKGIILYLLRILLSILCKVFTSNIIYSILYCFISFKDTYDVAISYSNNVNNKSLYYGYNKLVLDKVNSKMKLCWIHIDYINRGRLEWEYNEFRKFDKIVLVSNNCKKIFDKIYPDLKSKTCVVYNYLNSKELLFKSNEFVPDFRINNSIISIGRLEKGKNFEMQLNLARRLREKKVLFNWYVIGDGINRNELIELSKLYELTDCFVFLGSKENVYPYIKSSKILISTSLSESFGLTIAEALVLNTPVVALNYPSLSELISDNGIICNSEEDIYKYIYKLLTDDNYYKKIKGNTIYKITKDIVDKQLMLVLEGNE